MSKLNKIVKIIEKNLPYFNHYFKNKIFYSYNIKLIDFNNIKHSLEDALKLFYFSLTTRQRSPNKPVSKTEMNVIKEEISSVLKELNDINIPVEKRYENSLVLLNNIKGAGHKINTMFIKFLTMHSINLPDKRKLIGILWIPLDVHILKFLFTRYKGGRSNRFNIFRTQLKALGISVKKDKTISRDNHFYQVQQIIRNKFKRDKIKSPPIILDNLWVIGSTRCVHTKFSSRISCNGCMFNVLYKKEEYV